MVRRLRRMIWAICLIIALVLSSACFADPLDNCFDLTDLAILADEWLLSGSGLYCDIYTDSKIDFKDYALVAADWPADGACECRYWQIRHPEWIFCDDFEDNTALVRQGSPAKLSRATVFTSPAVQAQAMIAHLWSSGDYLLVDPVSLVDANSNVTSTKYNDFEHMQWLGYQRGITPIFDSQHADTWFCIEAHVRLNDPGQSNGIQEFWIDGQLEARRTGLNFVKSYQDYAINAIFLENYWNAGSPVAQQRYMDCFVVSTERIGCLCE